jgi:hypothetical protein
MPPVVEPVPPLLVAPVACAPPAPPLAITVPVEINQLSFPLTTVPVCEVATPATVTVSVSKGVTVIVFFTY